jgi:hypothetical protein
LGQVKDLKGELATVKATNTRMDQQRGDQEGNRGNRRQQGGRGKGRFYQGNREQQPRGGGGDRRNYEYTGPSYEERQALKRKQEGEERAARDRGREQPRRREDDRHRRPADDVW